MNQVERKVAVTNLEQEESKKDENLNPESESAEVTSESEIPTHEETTPELVEESVETEEIVSEEEVEEPVAEVIEEESESVVEEVEPEKVEEPLAEEETSEESESADVEEVSAADFYAELLNKAKEFVKQDDWACVSNELANLSMYITDGPQPEEQDAINAIAEFNTLKEEFEERKRAHYEELNKRKEENLAAKKEILKQFGELISEEKWTATKEVSQLRGKWESIKLLPQNEVDALNERFEELMKEFESHKVDRLVKKLQKEEENLTLKLVILEKMDKLNEQADSAEANFEDLNNEFHDLFVQWRKVGRVPAEKNQQIWDHYNTAQDKFNELRFKHDKKYRDTIERALQKKKKLIAEAESLLDNKDIAEAARQVNKLHKAWKKTGNLPQKEENELWDKFKAATDSFNEKKSENIDVLREQEQENLAAKMLLIEKAESIKDTDNYEQGHQAMQKLMDQWKEIGPVPRKKSSKIWKQFKQTMDDFYNERRNHFKDIRKDQKENLTRKNEILAKLEELGSSDDPAAAVQKAKELQAEFKTIGHVPLKYKNKIWKQYREVCDQIYGNFRSSGADLGMERRLASEGIEPGARKEIIKYQKELENLRKEVSKLESEMIQYEEAKTYFKPTNKGNKLRDELQGKVDTAVEQIAISKRKIADLVQKINELKDSASEDE